MDNIIIFILVPVYLGCLGSFLTVRFLLRLFNEIPAVYGWLFGLSGGIFFIVLWLYLVFNIMPEPHLASDGYILNGMFMAGFISVGFIGGGLAAVVIGAYLTRKAHQKDS